VRVACRVLFLEAPEKWVLAEDSESTDRSGRSGLR